MDDPSPAYGLENQTVADFLAECRVSSNRSYEAWKRLLQSLEERAEGAGPNAEAVRLLHALARAGLDDPGISPHFRFRSLELDRGQSAPLVVLELPSVFAPERWSFTFYEGLLRLPPGEWHGRTIAELGCGNGWILAGPGPAGPHRAPLRAGHQPAGDRLRAHQPASPGDQ